VLYFALVTDRGSSGESNVWGWFLTAAAFALPLTLAAYYEWLAWRSTAPGFPLDDAWIHAQFARNLASGRGFSYTGPQWVSGSTAPFWTVLLAAGYAFTHDIVIAAKVLGLSLQVATAWLAGRLIGWLTDSRLVAGIAAVMVGSVPIMVWGAVSGMEVALSACLVVAGLFSYFRGAARSSPTAVLPGVALLTLAALARPENLAILGIVLLDLATRRHQLRQYAVRMALAIIVAIVTLAPAVLLSYATIGRPLPTTFYAKSGPGLFRAVQNRDATVARKALSVHAPEAMRQFAVVLGNELGMAAWLVPLAAVVLLVRTPHRRAAALLLLLIVVVPFAIGAMMPQRLKPDNVRYAGQLVVLSAAVLSALMLAVVNRGLVPVVALATLVVTPVAVRAAKGASDFALSVKNINELEVALGKWMHEHLPKGSVVAVNDVGAIAYFSGLRILDIEGLVTPEALPYRARPGRGLAFVLDTHPDFVAIFPLWYPEVVARTDLFQKIHEVRIFDNIAAGDNVLVVLSTPWTRPLATLRSELSH
jgi:hypothetical protein